MLRFQNCWQRKPRKTRFHYSKMKILQGSNFVAFSKLLAEKTKKNKVPLFKNENPTRLTFCCVFKIATTSTNDNSPQHQPAWSQHSYVCSSSILIYSNPPSLHPRRKFPFPVNLVYDILPPQPRTICFSFSP